MSGVGKEGWGTLPQTPYQQSSLRSSYWISSLLVCLESGGWCFNCLHSDLRPRKWLMNRAHCLPPCNPLLPLAPGLPAKRGSWRSMYCYPNPATGPQPLLTKTVPASSPWPLVGRRERAAGAALPRLLHLLHAAAQDRDAGPAGLCGVAPRRRAIAPQHPRCP